MAFCGISPEQECQFVHNVKEDLETHLQKGNRKSVLLFPPLPSRLRYLIHRTMEERPELTTFSVGESWERRVVICHSELRGEVEDDSDLESNNNVNCEKEGSVKPKASVPLRSRGPKRPDKPLYMPRAARERLSLQNSHGPSGDGDLANPAPRHCGCTSSSGDFCSCPETAENTQSSSTSRLDSFPSAAENILSHDADTSPPCPRALTQNEAESLTWDQTESRIAAMSLEEDEKDEENLGDVTAEIKAHLKEAVTFSIKNVHNDYSVYENVFINPDEFRHVIEIYNFPPMFKTDDLLDAFTEYSDGGMKIKWIDNTHALGVFSSESTALRALSIEHPLLKTRPLAEGSKKAKGKVFRQAEFLQPVKERPRTDCAVAQRMVTRALGLRGRGRVQRY